MKLLVITADNQTSFADIDLDKILNQLNELDHKINVLNDKLNGLKETVDYLSDTIIDVYNDIDAINARLDKCNCPK